MVASCAVEVRARYMAGQVVAGGESWRADAQTRPLVRAIGQIRLDRGLEPRANCGAPIHAALRQLGRRHYVVTTVSDQIDLYPLGTTAHPFSCSPSRHPGLALPRPSRRPEMPSGHPVIVR